jgi:hypothetical protein
MDPARTNVEFLLHRREALVEKVAEGRMRGPSLVAS